MIQQVDEMQRRIQLDTFAPSFLVAALGTFRWGFAEGGSLPRLRALFVWLINRREGCNRAAAFRDALIAASAEQAQALQAASITHPAKTETARSALMAAGQRSDRPTVANATYELMTQTVGSNSAAIHVGFGHAPRSSGSFRPTQITERDGSEWWKADVCSGRPILT